MNIFKKLCTLCLVFLLSFAICSCGTTPPPTDDEINSMFDNCSVNTSDDFTIIYDDSDFVSSSDDKIVFKNNSKIKLSSRLFSFSEASSVSYTNTQIAYGFKINNKFYSFDYFNNNYITLTKDTTISIYYENISLFGILIYQNVSGNNNWDNLVSNPNEIKSLVSISNETVTTNETFLTYLNFSKGGINSNTNHIFNNTDTKNTLSLELFLETTEIISCLIYTDENNNIYFCNFIDTLQITNENILLYELDNINIYLSKNLSYKKG